MGQSSCQLVERSAVSDEGKKALGKLLVVQIETPGEDGASFEAPASKRDENPSDRRRKRDLEPGRETVISTEGLCSGYGAASVIRDINLKVEAGELVAVLGANGAGKSTLMRALSGLNRPVEGTVRFLSEHIETQTASQIARRGLVLVPEGRQVFPELTVIDNLQLGAYARPSADLIEMTERLLDRFPQLKSRQNQRAGLLSGGEQQMLAIARGLIARPRVLLLDEPSLGLAPILLDGLYDLLAELREQGMTTLLVDQMAGLALSVADRAYLLQSGIVRHTGSASDLRADPALVRTYLGEHERAT